MMKYNSYIVGDKVDVLTMMQSSWYAELLNGLLREAPKLREVANEILGSYQNGLLKEYQHNHELACAVLVIKLIQHVAKENIRAFIWEGEEITNRADPLNVIHRLTTAVCGLPENPERHVQDIGKQKLEQAAKDAWKSALAYDPT